MVKKKAKRHSPIQALFESVEVVSLANGQLSITPVWRGCTIWNERDGGGPGMFRRMAGAARLKRFLNAHLKKALSESR